MRRFLAMLNLRSWSIGDLLWATVFAAILLTLTGRDFYPRGLIWTLFLAIFAFGSLRQVYWLLRGIELPFDPREQRLLWWSLLLTRALAVVLLIVGSLWPEPFGWFSSVEPDTDRFPMGSIDNEYGYYWSFRIRSDAVRLMLPLGILLAC